MQKNQQYLKNLKKANFINPTFSFHSMQKRVLGYILVILTVFLLLLSTASAKNEITPKEVSSRARTEQFKTLSETLRTALSGSPGNAYKEMLKENERDVSTDFTSTNSKDRCLYYANVASVEPLYIEREHVYEFQGDVLGDSTVDLTGLQLKDSMSTELSKEVTTFVEDLDKTYGKEQNYYVMAYTADKKDSWYQQQTGAKTILLWPEGKTMLYFLSIQSSSIAQPVKELFIRYEIMLDDKKGKEGIQSENKNRYSIYGWIPTKTRVYANCYGLPVITINMPTIKEKGNEALKEILPQELPNIEVPSWAGTFLKDGEQTLQIRVETPKGALPSTQETGYTIDGFYFVTTTGTKATFKPVTAQEFRKKVPLPSNDPIVTPRPMPASGGYSKEVSTTPDIYVHLKSDILDEAMTGTYQFTQLQEDLKSGRIILNAKSATVTVATKAVKIIDNAGYIKDKITLLLGGRITGINIDGEEVTITSSEGGYYEYTDKEGRSCKVNKQDTSDVHCTPIIKNNFVSTFTFSYTPTPSRTTTQNDYAPEPTYARAGSIRAPSNTAGYINSGSGKGYGYGYISLDDKVKTPSNLIAYDQSKYGQPLTYTSGGKAYQVSRPTAACAAGVIRC